MFDIQPECYQTFVSGMFHYRLIKAIKICSMCAENSLMLKPVWVPTEEKMHANYISKLVEVDDWALNPVLFCDLDMILGPHTRQ